MNQNQPTPTVTLFLVLTAAALLSSATAANDDILVATQEMQKANYFTFVMLLNMAPSDAFQGNITFLMPNDRSLATTTAMAGANALDFLLRHSIPSPLLVDHLERFPTGSMIPASKPGFMFEVANGGRRRLFLSNVRITSPNICTRGTSIRCHGVDGVAEPAMVPQPNVSPTTPACAAPMAPAPPSGLPPDNDHVPPAVVAVPPPSVAKVGRQKSSSCRSTVVDLLTILALMILVLIGS